MNTALTSERCCRNQNTAKTEAERMTSGERNLGSRLEMQLEEGAIDNNT